MRALPIGVASALRGSYRLVMSGKAPSGFVDRDVKRIRIVAAE
ncbi:MAG: hypothetical protein O7A98_02505 [Acidobacteria bacterium]|nr:hypothetical protein [Acidobacteriota bacterium]